MKTGVYSSFSIYTISLFIVAGYTKNILEFRTYKLELFNDGKGYYVAKSMCEQRNAWLVEIKDEEIYKTVKNLTSHDIWIGMNYLPAREWRWNNGPRPRFTKWKTEPIYKGSQFNHECIRQVGSTGQWINNDCKSGYRFVCQSDTTFNGTCVSTLCSNRGLCSLSAERYTCDCQTGFFGTKCEKDILEIFPKTKVFEANRGHNITAVIDILSYDGVVKIEMKTSNGEHLMLKKAMNLSRINVRATLEFTIGPVNNNVVRVFKASTYTTPDNFIISTVSVNVREKVKINKVEPKSVAIPPSGVNIDITCHAKGLPTPDIDWYRSGMLIGLNKNHPIHQIKNMGVTDLILSPNSDISFAGVYTCVARNVIDWVHYSVNQSIIVSSKMKLIDYRMKNENKNVTFDITLECTYESYPIPSIYWNWINVNQTIGISSGISHDTLFKVQSNIISDTRSESRLHIRMSTYLKKTSVYCFAKNKIQTSKTHEFKLNENLLSTENVNFKMYSEYNEVKSYTDAKEYCEWTRGTLAKISNHDEQMRLSSALTSLGVNFNVLIGGIRFKDDKHAVWRWQDNNIFFNESKDNKTYSNWNVGEPTRKNNCVGMLAKADWKWGVVNCTEKMGFVCAYPVQGKPRNITVIPEKSRIKISFATNKKAIGITHRIELQKTDNVVIDVHDFVPTLTDHVSRTFYDLQHSTIYKIKITVCPHLCPNPLNVDIKIATLNASKDNPNNFSEVNQIQQTFITTSGSLSAVIAICGVCILVLVLKLRATQPEISRNILSKQPGDERANTMAMIRKVSEAGVIDFNDSKETNHYEVPAVYENATAANISNGENGQNTIYETPIR